MSSAFKDAANSESLEGTFGLPDIDDEHVVAAALVGGAAVIVTSQLKDFPQHRIPKPLKVIPPAQFAADIVAVSPDVAYHAVMAMSSRFVRPSSTVDPRRPPPQNPRANQSHHRDAWLAAWRFPSSSLLVSGRYAGYTFSMGAPVWVGGGSRGERVYQPRWRR
jgi:hypothetical protein